MFLSLCGICCVLILPVFAVGMAGLQDKLLVLSRRSPGRRAGGGGGGRWLWGRTPGAASASWPRWTALGPGSGTPSCELAEGEGREGLYLLALSSDEGEACMGQTSGNRCWRRTCQNWVEGRGAMHMLLDTGGLEKP